MINSKEQVYGSISSYPLQNEEEAKEDVQIEIHRTTLWNSDQFPLEKTNVNRAVGWNTLINMATIIDNSWKYSWSKTIIEASKVSVSVFVAQLSATYIPSSNVYVTSLSALAGGVAGYVVSSLIERPIRRGWFNRHDLYKKGAKEYESVMKEGASTHAWVQAFKSSYFFEIDMNALSQPQKRRLWQRLC